jgi:hypothetical protein
MTDTGAIARFDVLTREDDERNVIYTRNGLPSLENQIFEKPQALQVKGRAEKDIHAHSRFRTRYPSVV